MNIVTAYVDFMLRPLPTHDTPRAVDAVDNLWRDTALWTAFFSLLFLIVPYTAKTLFPQWYSALNERKRREFPSYLVCLVHHCALVPLAWMHVYRDFMRSEEALQSVHYALEEATVAPFCLGYLLGDTLGYALPELLLRGKTEYMLHHVLTVFLVVQTMFASGHIARFIPHLLMSDTTNIFFNTAWLLRLQTNSTNTDNSTAADSTTAAATAVNDNTNTNISENNKAAVNSTTAAAVVTAEKETSSSLLSSLITVLELCFALSFLLCRVVNMPFAFLAAARSEVGKSLGVAVWALLPIAALQWYWFAKIVRGLGDRVGGKKGEKDERKQKKQ